MLPQRGRPGATLLLSIERDLNRSDLARLAIGRENPRLSPAPMLKRLRAVHHLMARHLAAGRSVTEVALMVSYTAQRVGDLTRDPNFQNLMAIYGEQIADSQFSKIEKFKALQEDIADMAGEELVRRLEDPATLKQLSTSELRQLSGDALNRVGLPVQTAQPPQAQPVKITFSMGGRGLRDVTPPKEIEHDSEPE